MPGQLETGKPHPAQRRGDVAALGVVLFYCAVYAAVRLAISSTMGLDDAEQFLGSASLSWGYARQPPLYTWLVWTAFSLFGRSVEVLVAVKYLTLFLFYGGFYLLARSFWNVKESLLVTASLLLIPTYSYEFNREATHNVLMTAMAVATCLFAVRLALRQRTADYVFLGVFVALGGLSKYNFALFVIALLLAAVSTSEGRRAIFDKRMALSASVCLALFLPHLLWLVREDFLPVRYALERVEAGETPGSLSGVFSVMVSPYLDVLVYAFLFLLFFRGRFSLRGKGQAVPMVEWLALYALAVPLVVTVLFQAGNFQGRWLASVLFTVPLAMFSRTTLRDWSWRVGAFGALCVFAALAVLGLRSFAGFFPDEAGKVERINTPFEVVSLGLRAELERQGVEDFKGYSVASGDPYLAANVMAWLPGSRFVPLDTHEAAAVKREFGTQGGVVVWNESSGDSPHRSEAARAIPSAVFLNISAPYLHARQFPPYVLGAAVVPPQRQRHTR
jgi:4-amino-4-deoxy-L-arabinose transferase-like glycosyltransferase